MTGFKDYVALCLASPVGTLEKRRIVGGLNEDYKIEAGGFQCYFFLLVQIQETHSMKTGSEDDNRGNAWKPGRSSRVSTGFLVKIIVSAGAVAWVVWGMDWSGFSAKLEQVNWFIILLSAGVFSSMLLPSAFRWRGVTAVCGIPISWSQSLRYYLIGAFFNNFFPTGRGGDVARIALAARDHGYPYAAVLGTVMVERLSGLLVAVGFVVTVGAFLSEPWNPMGFFVPSLILGGVLAGCAFLAIHQGVRRFFLGLTHRVPIKWLHKIIEDLFRVLDACRKHPVVFVSLIGFSILNQILLVLAGLFMGLSIKGFGAPWYSYFLVVPLNFVAVLLPSLGGYGVREAGFVIFFGWFGVSQESALAFGMLHLICYWTLSLTGAYLFISRGGIPRYRDKGGN